MMEQLRAPCIFERVSHQENSLPMSKVSGVAGVERCQVEHLDLKSIKWILTCIFKLIWNFSVIFFRLIGNFLSWYVLKLSKLIWFMSLNTFFLSKPARSRIADVGKGYQRGKQHEEHQTTCWSSWSVLSRGPAAAAREVNCSISREFSRNRPQTSSYKLWMISWSYHS